MAKKADGSPGTSNKKSAVKNVKRKIRASYALKADEKDDGKKGEDAKAKSDQSDSPKAAGKEPGPGEKPAEAAAKPSESPEKPAATSRTEASATPAAEPPPPAAEAPAAEPAPAEEAPLYAELPDPRAIDFKFQTPEAPEPPPGIAPQGDSRSFRRLVGDTWEFLLIYRHNRFIISRSGRLGTRGTWKLMEYPTQGASMHAYAQECSKLKGQGYRDLRP